MKKTLFVLTLLLALPLARAEGQPRPSKEESDKLFHTVEALDAQLFDAYNRCDLDKMSSMVAEDLEFYHDQSGLSRGRQDFLDSIKKYICGKVRRDLVPGSLEVYPLKTYGAVEIGSHHFCDPKTHAKCEGGSGVGDAKFVMLWEEKNGSWKLTRVISYDHASH